MPKRVTSQENPRKREALDLIRQGGTIAGAAKIAGVSERSIVAWCHLHKVGPYAPRRNAKIKIIGKLHARPRRAFAMAGEIFDPER